MSTSTATKAFFFPNIVGGGDGVGSGGIPARSTTMAKISWLVRCERVIKKKSALTGSTWEPSSKDDNWQSEKEEEKEEERKAKKRKKRKIRRERRQGELVKKKTWVSLSAWNTWCVAISLLLCCASYWSYSDVCFFFFFPRPSFRS